MNRIERIQADLAREGDAYRAHFVADDVRALLRLAKSAAPIVTSPMVTGPDFHHIVPSVLVAQLQAALAALEAPCEQ